MIKNKPQAIISVMSKGSLILVWFILLGLFPCFFVAQAQVQSTDVTLSITPEYPNPGDTVTARLSSYVTNLDKANLTWSVNGEKKLSGVGKKSFSFTLGKLGSNTLLSVDVQTIDRQSFTKSLNLSASEIDLLWEAVDSYTPPFYKGKTLVSREGTFKVVAIPSIVSGAVTVNPNNLSYTWEKDGNGQTEASGWGKNYFTFKNSYLDEFNEISVKVSDIFGNVNTKTKTVLQTFKPKIVLYKKSIVGGIDLSRSLGNGHLLDKAGETLVAAPYFLSPKNLISPNLQLNWSINNQPARASGLKNEIRLKGEEGTRGEALIKINISNNDTLFQSVEKEINVVF